MIASTSVSNQLPGSTAGLLPAQLGAPIGVVPKTALLGVGVAALVWGLRLLIRRHRSTGSWSDLEGVRPLPADERGIRSARATGSGAPDVLWTIPIPVSGRGPRALTHADLYAVELGVVGGALLAWVASLTVADPVVGSLVGAGMSAVAVWRVRSLAAATVRAAPVPWLLATTLGATIGVVVFF